MNLTGFFQDSDGVFSFQRLQASIIQGTILIVWVYVSVKKCEISQIPQELINLSGLSFTSLAVGKINETIKAVKASN